MFSKKKFKCEWRTKEDVLVKRYLKDYFKINSVK